MSTTINTPWDRVQYPQIGQSVTYVLRQEELLQYKIYSVSASVAAVHTPTCVDLSVTLGGKALTLTNVTQDATNPTQGTWH